MTKTSVLLSVMVVALAGCMGKPAPAAPPRGAYLCCNLRFNQDREATDAGYQYENGTTLAAGTWVGVVNDGQYEVILTPTGQTTSYSLDFRYGRKNLSASEYFGRILVDQDPTAHLPSATREAVSAGTLKVGMSRDDVLMVRGYPPAHRTPTIAGDTWLFYTSPGVCQQVQFMNANVSSIETVPAPQ